MNRLHREGCLRPGARGHWVWSRDGEEVARIGYHVNGGQFVLNYRVRMYGGEWEPITEAIPITHVGCNFGNQRPYFLCPGVVSGRHCGRRVGKLFSGGRYFLCRHCHDIGYSSQSEVRYDRMLRRANKLRRALGGAPGTAQLIAPKPKGMWHRTYEQIQFEIEWCEDQADRAFIERFRHLLSDEDAEMFFGP